MLYSVGKRKAKNLTKAEGYSTSPASLIAQTFTDTQTHVNTHALQRLGLWPEEFLLSVWRINPMRVILIIQNT